ncbi:unnamed protein product [Somion occarium]
MNVNQPVLSFDVLSGILAFSCSRNDLLAMMQVCHTLYRAGIRILLAEGVDHFSSSTQLASFCLFMTVDLPSRCSMIRKLHIHAGSLWEDEFVPSREDVQTFASILRHATRLNELTLFGGEQLVEKAPEVAAAISSLASLRVLTVGSEDDSECEGIISALENMQSPIKSLTVCLDPNGSDCGPVPFIRALQANLETLTINWALWMSERLASETILCPEVKSISIYDWEQEDINIGTLMKTFPNLRSLTIDSEVGEGHDSYHPLDGDDDRHRMNLQKDQSQGWPFLKAVCGGICSLYSLGLARPVNHLTLSAMGLSPHYVDYLSDIILNCKPKRVTIPIPEAELERASRSFRDRSIDNASFLSYLDLLIKVDKALSSDQIEQMLDHIALVIHPFSPEEVTIRLQTQNGAASLATRSYFASEEQQTVIQKIGQKCVAPCKVALSITSDFKGPGSGEPSFQIAEVAGPHVA